MGEIAYLNTRHPLVGRWFDEHALVEYDVFRAPGGFRVEARLHLEGLAIPVQSVGWDGSTLTFATRAPVSAEWTHHMITVEDDGAIQHRFSGTEIWTRRPG